MVVKAMKWTSDRAVLVCTTVIAIWIISAVTALVMTGHSSSLFNLFGLLSSGISSIAVLLGVSKKVENRTDEVKAEVQALSNPSETKP